MEGCFSIVLYLRSSKVGGFKFENSSYIMQLKIMMRIVKVKLTSDHLFLRSSKIRGVSFKNFGTNSGAMTAKFKNMVPILLRHFSLLQTMFYLGKMCI